MGNKYRNEYCPRCHKETLHRIKTKYSPRQDRGAVIKRVSLHCMICNKYHTNIKRNVQTVKHISFRK